MNPLPIEKVIPDLRGALKQHRNVILTADPGAGKTTRVPLALLDERWLDGRKLIMLEPRRLAARRAAVYMAGQLGERVGETVGYRIRGDSMVGRQTRIEIVTEGILTRMLQDNAGLPGVGLVVFDEFHERSIHADLGLAFTLDVQEHLRNDLRIVVMSATLDVLSLASFLGDHAVVKSDGRIYMPLRRRPRGRLAEAHASGTGPRKRAFSFAAVESAPCGEMAERLKAHAWKACVRETVPWVRIPLSPLH